MRKIVILLLACLCLLTAEAQVADGRVAELIGAGDWFALEREYPALKDSVQDSTLRLMAETLTAAYFNRDDEAVSLIDTLVANHQAEIGFGNTMSMLIIQSAVEKRRGNYAKAFDKLGSFISQVKAQAPQADISQAEVYYNMYKHLRNYERASLSRPHGDVTVELMLERQRRNDNDTSYVGYSMYMPVSINGKRYKALIDTGCANTLCPGSIAEELGITAQADTTTLIGVGTVKAATCTIDSINIGAMTMRNALTTIVTDGDMDDTAGRQYDMIIGLDFLKLCGEAQFYPKEGKIVFPERCTPLPRTGHNLLLTEADNLRLEAYADGERCRFFLDTGNSITALSLKYYGRHKDEIDRTARKVTRKGGGIGFGGMLTTLKTQPLTLSTGGADVTLEHVAVPLANLAPIQIDDGNVGVNLIQDCRKATLNLKDLFLKIEN